MFLVFVQLLGHYLVVLLVSDFVVDDAECCGVLVFLVLLQGLLSCIGPSDWTHQAAAHFFSYKASVWSELAKYFESK